MSASRTVAIAVLVVAGGAVSAGQQVFRARVDAVVVDVLVTDRNRPVRGLTARDFELTDNGVPQQIADISGESLPLDVTLVVDMSGRGILQPSLVAAANKVRQSLRAGDRVRIITFSDTVNELTPLVDPASAPPLPPLPALTDFVPIGQTACYDAIALSIAVLRITGRRQLAIVFSAGRDTTSSLDSGAVLDVARRSATAVFAVRARFDTEPMEAPREGATRVAAPIDPLAIPVRFFKTLTEETGGRMEEVAPFTLVRDDSKGWEYRARLVVDLAAPFLRAIDDFRTSYVLRYAPEGVSSTGWHDIVVRVPKGDGRYEVTARKGYYR